MKPDTLSRHFRSVMQLAIVLGVLYILFLAIDGLKFRSIPEPVRERLGFGDYGYDSY